MCKNFPIGFEFLVLGPSMPNPVPSMVFESSVYYVIVLSLREVVCVSFHSYLLLSSIEKFPSKLYFLGMQSLGESSGGASPRRDTNSLSLMRFLFPIPSLLILMVADFAAPSTTRLTGVRSNMTSIRNPVSLIHHDSVMLDLQP